MIITDIEKQTFLNIDDLDKLAKFLCISKKLLIMHSYRKYKDQYHTFEISKKSGGKREIKAPCSSLKEIQRKIADVLYFMHQPSHFSHGFEPKRSIKSNALVHQNKKFILNIDLQDFFPTIHFGRIRGLFKAKPFQFNEQVATVLANLCTVDTKLPQGAPTSPILSNLICKKLDRQLKKFSTTNKCTYSRYADDITISTNKNRFPGKIAIYKDETIATEIELGEELVEIIRSSGFNINPKKSRLLNKEKSQIVTGLVTNQFVNVKRSYIRSIKGILNRIDKNKLPAEQANYIANFKKPTHSNDLIEHLKGKIEFIGTIRGANDTIYLELLSRLQQIDSTKFTDGHIAQIEQRNLSEHEKLDKSLWVLESPDSEEDGKVSIQGTAFELEGVNGLVTCYHNLFNLITKEKYSLEASKFSKPFVKYKILSIEKCDEHLDLAIIRVDCELNNKLPLSKTIPSRSTEILIAGHPNYNTGNQPFICHSKVTLTKTVSFKPLICLDRPILYGNSGGPLLNNRFEVCGVALYGGENNTEGYENLNTGGIEISALNQMK
jgi:retron-type reverse transcriptase